MTTIAPPNTVPTNTVLTNTVAANTVAALKWPALTKSLDDQGYAVTPPLLSTADCAELTAMYDRPEAWQSRTIQDSYRLGPGEYQLFRPPLLDTIATLRDDCYEHLAPIANEWQRKLNQQNRFPDTLTDYIDTCHASGQTNPTVLIRKHSAQHFTCLHQDDHGEHMFPLQLMVMLSKANKDYTGGEFILMEQLPRAQSRGRAVVLKQGQAVIWPTSQRPGTGNRGHYRIGVRHGTSTVHTGTRHTLEINFHDAN
jgi:hypothetical protein